MNKNPRVAGMIGLLLAGCATTALSDPSAEAILQPTRGFDVRGSVMFKQAGDKVQVVAKVGGLTPGSHGFHIHEKGDCSAPDAMSAGGHFNPGGKPHGHPHQGEHHAGDMPMLEADSNGNATLTTELPSISIREGANSILGRSVIVHISPDDFKTQPTGNSGARMACGVIAAK